jgi:hypothetical protein
MTDYKSALWMPVPLDNVFIDSWGYTRKFLVLHKTAGGSSAQAVAAYFQAGAGGNRTSSHYIVGQDGVVVQCVAEKDGAGANCCLETGHDPFWPTDVNLNLVTFSIENVDPATDNSTPMPQKQKSALFSLIVDLCVRQHIPMRPADANGGIAGHSSIAPLTRKRCPGNFPWDELWAFLVQQNKELHMGIPQNWHDDGTTLTAPNGHKVVHGFRDYILSHNWDANNYPLEEEHTQSPLEISDPALGTGTQQMFRWTSLEWTPQQGVFVSWVGQELLALRAQTAQLTAEIATLKQQQGTTLPKAWHDALVPLKPLVEQL